MTAVSVDLTAAERAYETFKYAQNAEREAREVLQDAELDANETAALFGSDSTQSRRADTQYANLGRALGNRIRERRAAYAAYQEALTAACRTTV